MVEDRRKRPPNRRLDSWKEIASYFGRDERTLKRWEKERGLPVRRLPGAHGGVYAFTDDLARWTEESSPGNAAPPASNSTQSRTTVAEIATSAVTAVCEPHVRVADQLDPAPHFSEDGHKLKDKTQSVWVLPVALLLLLGISVVTFGILSRKHVFASRSGPSDNRELKTQKSRVANPKAQELYLEGRYYWNKRTPSDLNKALSYFQQAIAIDPQYARAYVGVADCYNLLREFAVMPEAEAYPKAIAAAKKGVELDDSLAEAHNSLAFGTFYWFFDAAAAEREFRDALRLNPNYELAHHWYATFLMTIGRNQEALEQIEIAQELDSSSTSTIADKGLILYHGGHAAEAIALLKQIDETEPSFLSTHRYLAEIYLETGKYPDYVEEARRAALLSKDETELAVVEAAAKGYKNGGTQAMWESMLREEKSLYGRGHISAYRLAQTCSLVGQQREALGYLRIAQEHRDSALSGLLSDFHLMKLRDDPEYRELISRIGLPPLTGS